MRVVCRFLTGSSSGSSSSSPVGCRRSPWSAPVTKVRSYLIDVDRRSYRDHRIELLDVLVPHAHAAVAHGTPDRLRRVRSVNSVAVAKLESPRTENTHVPPGSGSVWRNDNVAVGDDLMTFLALAKGNSLTIAVALHDLTVLRRHNSTVPRRNRLTRTQVHQAESFLVCHLDVMPVGRNPRGILILSFDDEASTRRLEAPLAGAATNELLAASGRNGRLEQHFLPLLVPKPVIRHADDDVRFIGCFSRRLVDERLQ